MSYANEHEANIRASSAGALPRFPQVFTLNIADDAMIVPPLNVGTRAPAPVRARVTRYYRGYHRIIVPPDVSLCLSFHLRISDDVTMMRFSQPGHAYRWCHPLRNLFEPGANLAVQPYPAGFFCTKSVDFLALSPLATPFCGSLSLATH
jgi:hypothetical protein